MRTILSFIIACLCLLWTVPAQNTSQGGDKKKSSAPTQQSGDSSLLGGSPSTPPLIILSGKVMLPDGSIPPQQVRVELVCRENVREHSFTAPDGSFVFQIDESTPMAGMDASFGAAELTPRAGSGAITYDSTFDNILRQRIGDSPSTSWKGCELRATVPNFRSERILLESRRIQGYFDAGIIVISPSERPAVGTTSINSLAAPSPAKRAFHEAQRELLRENPDRDKVLKKLEEAVGRYPRYAVAWELLGKMRLTSGDAAGARRALEKAADADPEYAGGHLALAELNFQEHRWEETAAAAYRVMELNPGLISPYYLHAFSSFQAGHFETSKASAEHLRRVGAASQFPVIHYILGAVALRKNDLQKAATEFQRFLELQPDSPVADSLQQQLRAWEGQGIVPHPQDSDPEGGASGAD